MKSNGKQGKSTRNPPTTTSSSNRLDMKKSIDKSHDPHFSYNMTILVGCQAEVTTRNGDRFAGIFVAYSSSQEIMLEAAHLITDDNNQDSSISKHFDVLIIPADKLMMMKFEDASLNYATRDFQTDSFISANRTSNFTRKELLPWDGGDSEPINPNLDLSEGGETNGWATDDMFKKNAEKFGVKSSYDQHLTGYTTSLDKSDVDTFKKHEEQAIQIAEEIEKSSISNERCAAENGDEEDRFSAVVRDSSSFTNTNANVNNNNNNIITNTSNDNRTDKYVPPSRRNQTTPHTQTSALNSPNLVSPSNHAPPPGPANTRKPNFVGQRSYATSAGGSFYSQDQRRTFERRPGPNQPQYGQPHNDGSGRPLRGGKVTRPLRDDFHHKKELTDSQPYVSSNEPPRKTVPTTNLSSSTSAQQQPNSNHVQLPSMINPQTRGSAGGGASTSPPNSNNSRTFNNHKSERDKNITQNPTPDGPHVKLDKTTPPPTSTGNESNVSTKVDFIESSTTVVESIQEDKPQNIANSDGAEIRSPLSSINEKNDTKSGELSESNKPKPFAFNPLAKEFNPSAKPFVSRAPVTPPRPPSTPASTPQLVPVPQGHPFIQMSQMPGTVYVAASPYSHALSPVANASLSINSIPPQRHPHPHRKNMAQRNEMPTSLPVQTAGPLLAQGGIPNTGPHPQYAQYTIPHQHGFPQPVRIHTPNIVFSADGSGDGNPIHMPLHYIQSGTPTPAHPSSQSIAHVSGQNSIMPGNPQGYTQNGPGGAHGPQQHMGSFPFVGVGLPVIYPPPHPPGQILQQTRFFE